MAIKYSTIFNAVALRADLLTDGNSASVEEAYSAADLESKIDSTEITFSALRDDILRVEKDIAVMIANSNNSFYKSKIGTGRSKEITQGIDPIPATDENDREFIGAITGVLSVASNRPLVEKTKAEIYRFFSADSRRSFFTVPVYYFAIDGDRLLATADPVYITGIVWDEEARRAAFTSTGESILPLEFENLWICKVLSNLVQSGFFVQEAQIYTNRADQMQADLMGGRVQMRSLPQIPVKQASADIRD